MKKNRAGSIRKILLRRDKSEREREREREIERERENERL